MMALEYRNIIVAMDGSTESEKAFSKSIQIAKDNHSRLILTHVIDSRLFTTTGIYDQALEEHKNDEAEKMMREYAKQAHQQGVQELKICIENGSPKVKIAKDIAIRHDADLIICGAKGLNAVERFLMGSVSESITRNASCDVLVVR